MIDLRNLSAATNCIKAMKENGTYRNNRIGIINSNINGGLTSIVSGFPDFHKGEVVLFREELFPSDSQLRMGEYMGVKQKPNGYITIERPFTQEEIDKQRAKGSLITTYGTMVCVPRKYLTEVRI